MRDAETRIAVSIVCGMLLVLATASAYSGTDQVRFRYATPTEPEHQQIHAELIERRALERLREFLAPFRLPRKLTFVLEGCDGEADAFYGDDRVTICYEYVEALWSNAPDETTPAGIEPFDTVVSVVELYVPPNMSTWRVGMA